MSTDNSKIFRQIYDEMYPLHPSPLASFTGRVSIRDCLLDDLDEFLVKVYEAGQNSVRFREQEF